MKKKHTLSTAIASTAQIVGLLLILAMLPASVAVAGAGNRIPNSLSQAGLLANPKSNPSMDLKSFWIIKPESGKTYESQIPVHIRVPADLPGNPTITLKLICRPLKKGLLEKRSYFPKTTLLSMPLYARYKDRVLTTVMTVNLRNQVFRGAAHFSALEFRIKATIRAGQTTMSRTSGWFRIHYDDRSYRQENSMLRYAPGISFEGQHDTFYAPATVRISVGHSWNCEIEYMVQYCDRKFGKRYQTIPLKAQVATKNEVFTILTFHITKPGYYRVRARNRKPGAQATWSRWCEFTVNDRNFNGISGVGSNDPEHKFKRSPLPHTSGARSINPQPEPPGRPVKVPGLNEKIR